MRLVVLCKLRFLLYSGPTIVLMGGGVDKCSSIKVGQGAYKIDEITNSQMSCQGVTALHLLFS